jgi:hypothetical protein
MNKYFDIGTIGVIVITFFLFLVSLFVKGLTHDIMLEAGILLISVKLIMMAYKTGTYFNTILRELGKINALLNKDDLPR